MLAACGQGNTYYTAFIAGLCHSGRLSRSANTAAHIRLHSPLGLNNIPLPCVSGIHHLVDTVFSYLDFHEYGYYETFAFFKKIIFTINLHVNTTDFICNIEECFVYLFIAL